MICKNCGASFEDNLYACPYCNHENSEFAQKVYSKEISEVVGKIKNIKEETKKEEKKISKKSTKVFAVSIIILIAAIFVTYLVREIFYDIVERQEAKAEKKFLTEIDVYYRNGDYEGLYRYYHDNMSYSLKAIKYQEIVTALGDMRHIKNYNESVRLERNIYPVEIYAILEEFNSLSKSTYEKTNDSTIYGNEQILLDLEAEAKEFLKKTLGLSEEKIETVKKAEVQRYSGKKNEMLWEITKEICDRLGIKE